MAAGVVVSSGCSVMWTKSSIRLLLSLKDSGQYWFQHGTRVVRKSIAMDDLSAFTRDIVWVSKEQENTENN